MTHHDTDPQIYVTAYTPLEHAGRHYLIECSECGPLGAVIGLLVHTTCITHLINVHGYTRIEESLQPRD